MLFSNQVDGISAAHTPDALVNIPHAQAPLVTVDRLESGFTRNIRSDNYGRALAPPRSTSSPRVRGILCT